MTYNVQFKQRKSAFYCIALLFLCSSIVSAQHTPTGISEILKTRIETSKIPAIILVGEKMLFASSSLPLFYERRGYEPVWINEYGVKPEAYRLIETIKTADRAGLYPEDYHLLKLESVLENIRYYRELHSMVDLELLLTDAILIYGAHLLSGVVNPTTFDPEWYANRRTNDMADVLEKALAEFRVDEMLNGLDPPQTGFRRLREALARYRIVSGNGGWQVVSTGSVLRKGDSGPRVAALRIRLIHSEDQQVYEPDSTDLFDEVTEKAVIVFQQHHGLEPNGVIDTPTIDALNVSVDQRIGQIIINMERWRWLPQDLGRRYITVNIANYQLNVVEDEHIAMSQRVMVGQDFRQTTIFSDIISYLVLNPRWEVPNTIAVEDILPKIKKDPFYLTKQGMRLFRGWGISEEEVNRSSVNWSLVTEENFRYRIRQDPGPRNALGLIKFMFPNKFNVYLHDTPSRSLFNKTIRSLSSGCIRTENALSLAVYVLSTDPQWKRADIMAAVKTGQERTVRLTVPIPVHLLYWTAWADEDGSIQFRNDIYGRDKLLYEALRKKPETHLLGEK